MSSNVFKSVGVAVVDHRSLLGLFTSVLACRSGIRSFLLSAAAARTAAAYLQIGPTYTDHKLMLQRSV